MSDEPTMPAVRLVSLDTIGPGPDLRPLDPDHVAVLAEVVAATPPVVLDASTFALVDGAHRIAAARRAGRRYIRAELRELPAADVLAEAVGLNAAHGLPLTLEERKRAARRLMEQDPARSNAAVAHLAGLSRTTVARIRPAHATAPVRVGKDGKHYPTDRAARQAAAEQLLRRRPRPTIASIARATGQSRTTVTRIRDRLDGAQPGLLRRWLRRLLGWLRGVRPSTAVPAVRDDETTR